MSDIIFVIANISPNNSICVHIHKFFGNKMYMYCPKNWETIFYSYMYLPKNYNLNILVFIFAKKCQSKYNSFRIWV